MVTYSLPKESRRLFIRDRTTNISFLVDTGSDVSLIPANVYQKRNASQQNFFATNSNTINVYGQKTLTLNFNLRRDFMWNFLIADVGSPILGADFLHYFELVPDLINKFHRDTKTKLQSVGHLKHANLHSVLISVSINTIYHKLLKEFPSIVKLPNPNQPVKHNTVHYITKGPPVMAKPRRLARDRLKIAKTEFQNMMHLGHLRPSKSNYASPLHMVPKKAELHGSKVFRRIHLRKANHEIPVHPDDIHETAIWTPFGLFEKRYTNQKKSHCSVRISSEPLKWNENAEQVFLTPKNAISEATLLRNPIPEAQLGLWVDASDIAIGCTLSQLSQGKWEPIVFFFMKLNKSQQKWSTYDRELFSICSAIRKFKHIVRACAVGAAWQ
ncbi:transposon Ty3-G Gag-Pol polyprotein [Trichonephila clavipes]|nr:transposon Ty3-G Gag-Pol polyprotein [Trichonephila clavipes]